MLEKCNTGTITHLLTHLDGKFKFSFFALGACAVAFKNFARPVIVVDAAHLKGDYKGIVFVAVTQDPNRQIYPLATGVGDQENTKLWSLFLTKVRSALGCPNNMLIISDQHQSIINAVEHIFPGVAHGLCQHHLGKKFVPFGKGIFNIFERAASTYLETEFDRLVGALSGSDSGPRIWTIFIRAKKEHWSRFHCPVRRYEFMTSNAVESWNNCLKWPRRFPVTYLFERVCQLTQEWHADRSLEAEKHDGDLCARVTNQLAKLAHRADYIEVEHLVGGRFKVVVGADTFLFDLEKRSCDCGYYQHELIPCIHTFAAIRNKCLDVNLYVGEYFQNQIVRSMWGGSVHPLPDRKEWDVPILVRDRVCKPPDCPKQSGKPKRNRMKSALEPSRSVRRANKCSNCGGKNHNRATCTNSPAVPHNVEFLPPSERAPTIRQVSRKCSICHVPGHTKSACPNHGLRDVTDDDEN